MKFPDWDEVKDDIMDDDLTISGFDEYPMYLGDENDDCKDADSKKCWNSFTKESEKIYTAWKRGMESATHFYRGIAVSGANEYIDDLARGKMDRSVGTSWTFDKQLAEKFASFWGMSFPTEALKKERERSEGVLFATPTNRLTEEDINVPWSVGANIHWQMYHKGRSESEVRFALNEIYVEDACAYPSLRCVFIGKKLRVDD